MKISKIYKNEIIKNNHLITKITDNSQNVIPGSIFITIDGYTNNGENYIEEAINNGASTIVVNKNYNIEKYHNLNINFIKTIDTKKELALLLKLYYKEKLKKFKIIGITGTNGKTTSCTLLYKYLRSNNLNTICFTSNGNYINDAFYSTINTTPNITIIYDTIINSKLKKGYIIIEVSSQAISELRILGINFDIVGITNITTDHLDYHKNITDYFYTKTRLIHQLNEEGVLVLNNDSPHFSKLNSLTPNTVYSFGEGNDSDFKYEITQSTINNTLFFISNEDNIEAFNTTLIGKFNIQNITMVYSIIKILHIPLDKFNNFINTITPIKGRMNIYEINKRLVIIDYAHTVEAVKSSLETIKKFNKQNIKLVIGCGGNRDRLKRPIIGKLACLYADFVYFTEDNSRNESLSKILKEITCDLTSNNYMIIESRMKAIKKAVIDSKENDIIILMGKGLEKSSIDKEEYTDLEMIEKCFKEIKGE